jgi:hypothetical protein
MTQLRPVTVSLIESIFQGMEPTPAAIVDFGIDSPAHYAALSDAVLSGQIEAAQLDAALGHGRKLTELVNSVDGNPFHVEFHTSWDKILGRDGEGACIEGREQEPEYDRER